MYMYPVADQIHKFELDKKKYQWLHWSKSRGFDAEVFSGTDCTTEEIEEAAEGFIVLEPTDESNETLPRDHGLVCGTPTRKL